MKEKLKKLLDSWVERLQRMEQERFGFTETEAKFHAGSQDALETCIEELREVING